MAISIFDRLAALMGPTQTKSLLLHPVLQLFDSNDEELLQVLLSVSVARSFIQWFDFINFTEYILELYLDATAMENQKIAAVAFDTIVKLSSELGLAYTSRFILKHLLRLLNKTASAYVLRVLDEFAIRVGESLVICHFLPFTIMQVSQYNHNLEWILIYFNSGWGIDEQGTSFINWDNFFTISDCRQIRNYDHQLCGADEQHPK